MLQNIALYFFNGLLTYAIFYFLILVSAKISATNRCPDFCYLYNLFKKRTYSHFLASHDGK